MQQNNTSSNTVVPIPIKRKKPKHRSFAFCYLMQTLMSQKQLQMPFQDLQDDQQMHHHNNSSSQMSSHFDPASSNDDFLEQMLSTFPASCSWPELSAGTPKSLPWEDQFEEQSNFLATKLRQNQISAGGGGNQTKSLMLQQQLLLSRGLGGGIRSPNGASGNGESGLIPMPLNLTSADSFDRSQNDIVDASSFKSQGGGNSVQALFNGFTGNQRQHFHSPQGGTIQAQNFGAPSPVMNQAPANGSAGGAPAQPRQRVRARRGQATDPHSIAERLRRERIAERMKSLQELVPNANKTDKASMLDEIIDYVKFLQLQVKVLSMSRLGGAGAVAPLVADISFEGGGDCLQGSGGAGGRNTQTAASSSKDSMTVTENQVAKLMEQDMGSAMQYLQGKGLCLMPISLATAISTATCQPTTRNNFHIPLNNPLLQSNGEGDATSPTMSVMTVQSATMGNGLTELSVNDPTSP